MPTRTRSKVCKASLLRAQIETLGGHIARTSLRRCVRMHPFSQKGLGKTGQERSGLAGECYVHLQRSRALGGHNLGGVGRVYLGGPGPRGLGRV